MRFWGGECEKTVLHNGFRERKCIRGKRATGDRHCVAGGWCRQQRDRRCTPPLTLSETRERGAAGRMWGGTVALRQDSVCRGVVMEVRLSESLHEEPVGG